MKKFYRHGDIAIHSIEELPEGLKEKFSGSSFVLAEGETTGHKHVIVADRVEILEDKNGRWYMRLGSPAEIKHEEHQTIVIDPGIYEIGHEREKDWFSDITRQVKD